MITLAINIHKPAGSGAPLVALVDDKLHAEAQKIRWVTSTASDRPVYIYYDQEKGCAKTESLARWVWTKTYGEPPLNAVGVINGDCLDCRSSNLKQLRSPQSSDLSRTGKEVARVMVELGIGGAKLREQLGIPVEGALLTRGRRRSYTPEQAQEIRDLRHANPEMPLVSFNAEIVSEILGRRIGHIALNRILQNK